MRSLFSALCIATFSLSFLSGCGDTIVPAILSSAGQGQPSSDNPSQPRTNTCFKEALYLVEGDSFTWMSGGQQTIETKGNVGSGGGYGWNPEIEARAKSKVDLSGTDGHAALLWNDQVVDEFDITKSFLMSTRVAILSYDDEDGTRVELHVYAQPECGHWAFGVSTREQIEAIER